MSSIDGFLKYLYVDRADSSTLNKGCLRCTLGLGFLNPKSRVWRDVRVHLHCIILTVLTLLGIFQVGERSSADMEYCSAPVRFQDSIYKERPRLFHYTCGTELSITQQ